MWLGLMQSVEGLNRPKRLTLLGIGELLLHDGFEAGHWFLPVFRLERKHWVFLGFKPNGIWTELALLNLSI